MVDKRGRYADVLAVKGVAIVEVKSVSEGACNRNYEVRQRGDSAGLSPRLEAKIGPSLCTIRHEVFTWFPPRSPLRALYAVTVAAQLYRYVHEFEDLAAAYEKFTGSVKLRGATFAKVPFLVVPEERAGDLQEALAVLKVRGAVTSWTLERAGGLAVAEFAYP